MPKHAYLILAHAEPELLQLLVSLLDDARNDLYIHFDAKLRDLPQLSTTAAGLHILQERVPVYWADVSMIAAEYRLLHAAYDSGQDYSYYHLISGVDLPLKDQDYIHSFFAEHAGHEFIGLHQQSNEAEQKRKLRLRHLFPHSFRSTGILSQVKRFLRYAWLEVQERFDWQRNREEHFRKGGQWFSITTELVRYLLSCEEATMQRYAASFGSDEYFVSSLILDTPFMDRLYDATDECRGSLRYIGWNAEGQLVNLGWQHLELLRATECLFARKFASSDPAFIAEITQLSRTSARGTTDGSRSVN